jgi:hypothetical protein
MDSNPSKQMFKSYSPVSNRSNIDRMVTTSLFYAINPHFISLSVGSRPDSGTVQLKLAMICCHREQRYPICSMTKISRFGLG